MSRDTAISKSFENTNSKALFLKGALEARLPKGIYDIKASLLDEYGNEIESVSIPKSDLLKSYLIVAGEAPGELGLFSPFIIGGNVDFETKRASALITLQNPAGSYTYTLNRVPNPETRINWPGQFNSSGSAKINNSELSLIKIPGRLEPLLSYNNHSGNISVAEIDLPVKDMNPGTYALVLTGGGKVDTFKFDVLWESMPLYLRNIDEAAKVMKYLLTDEQDFSKEQ
jgi:hypothetical protein